MQYSLNVLYLVLIGLFKARDLPLEVLDVSFLRADESQQTLPLLLQCVYVIVPVIYLSLQAEELLSQQHPPGNRQDRFTFWTIPLNDKQNDRVVFTFCVMIPVSPFRLLLVSFSVCSFFSYWIWISWIIRSSSFSICLTISLNSLLCCLASS